MKILLTGATGFLGSALLKKLLEKGHEVIILKRSFSDLRRITNEIDSIKSYDVDKVSVENIFLENKKIDTIIHTATCYGRNNETAPHIFQSNTYFPLRIIDAASKNGVKTFINTGTMLPLAKTGQMHDYVLSKRQFIEWGRHYSQTVKFVNMKLDYIYGPFDDKTKLLPALIESCVKNIPDFNLTKGEQRRDFVYIDDVVDAYMSVIDFQTGNFEEFEIGLGYSVSLKEAALKIKELTGSAIHLNFGALPYRKDELMEAKTEISKLSSLGWKAEYDFENGIKNLLKTEYKRI